MKMMTPRKRQLEPLFQKPMSSCRPQYCASLSWMLLSWTRPWSSWYGPSFPSASRTSAPESLPQWSLNWGLCSTCCCGDSRCIPNVPLWASLYWTCTITTLCPLLLTTNLFPSDKNLVCSCSLQAPTGSRSALIACCCVWESILGPRLNKIVSFSKVYAVWLLYLV